MESAVRLLRRFWIGAQRKWRLLLGIGVAWLVIGPLIALNVPTPYSALILFVM